MRGLPHISKSLKCISKIGGLPQLAAGEANKLFVIPQEFTEALGKLSETVGRPKPPAGSGDRGSG